jgi:hypothetical protein
MRMERDSDLLQNAVMTALFPVLPTSAIDPTHCPLCGNVNVCAMEIERESGIAQPPCWCMSAVFSESLQDQIPVAARGQACICARCVAKAETTTSS